MNNKIELSLELMSVLIAEKTDLSQDDVNQYLKTNNIEADATIVENSSSEVNICLPYYSWVKDPRAIVSDAEINASGGQDFLTRLPPTDIQHKIETRNSYQLKYNLEIIFIYCRSDLADHSYDGDFSASNLTNMQQIVDDNPK